MSDNNGRGKTYAYDKAGLIKWIEDSLSAKNKNRVEVKRNIQAQVIEFLHKVQKEDDQGAFTQVTCKTGFVYDELGRATVVEHYGRSATKQAERRFGYDSLGRTTWFQKQLETSVFQDFEWNYDALGRVRETIRHAKTGATGTITTTSDYDDIPAAYGNDGFGTPLDASNLSQVIERHDARGLETTYLYDLLGRMVERRMPGYTTAGAGFSWTYRHDAEGRVDKWKDGNGHVIGVTRNSEKFPIQRHIESLGTGSALSEMTKWEKWDYDSLARKVTYRTYNGPLDPSTYPPGTGDAWLVDVVREFDALGRLKAEDFGYGDNGTSTDSRVHKRLTSSYAYGGGDDTGFRRGLSLPSNWDFGFTPDGAGKTSQITLKGPNDASAGLAAHYRYEGGRAHLRDWNADPANQQSLGFRTTWDTSELGYETHLTTVRDPSGSPTTVFDLEQGRDLEGNVLWKKYAKQVGGGDWFQNDGWNRLDEAKLGAPASDFGQGKTYAQAGFDTKLAYAMDVAHNRTSVTETQGANSTTTNYSVDTASNRYLDAGSGTLTYDLNGNLVFDGYRLYVYDYLDRLCEVWDYYDGTASSSSSTTTRKPVKLSLTEVRDFANTRRRDAYSRDVTKHGLSDYNKSTDNGRNLTSSSQSSSGPSFVLTALYGYDGMNRRTFRTTTATSEGLRYSTWDGWRMVEEYEDDGSANFSVRKVYFDGIGIDGHLGYATSSDGMNWTRYSLVQDSLGHVMAVYEVGQSEAVEMYEYDPYGTRTIYVCTGPGQYAPAPTTTVSNTYGFTGRRHDPETGFIYYRLRYYSPAMGRFITHDPIGNWGDGANWGNAQAYVGSAPAAAGDPFGLFTPGPGFAGLSFDVNGGSSGLLGCSMPGPNGGGAGGGQGGGTGADDNQGEPNEPDPDRHPRKSMSCTAGAPPGDPRWNTPWRSIADRIKNPPPPPEQRFGIWVEGPSGAEPHTFFDHLSLGVGDPLGDYQSYSFACIGVSLTAPFEGRVYEDTVHGGEIDPNRYIEVDEETTKVIRKILKGYVGQRGRYHLTNNCRTWTSEAFAAYKEILLREGLGKLAWPPLRLPPSIDYTYDAVISTVTTTYSTTKPEALPGVTTRVGTTLTGLTATDNSQNSNK